MKLKGKKVKVLCYVILMPLTNGNASTQILKLKTAYDEECMVVEHHKGKGQFENILGSLTCETIVEIQNWFWINLSERENPPPIGTTITYKYRGLTNSGNLVLPLIGERKNKNGQKHRYF